MSLAISGSTIIKCSKWVGGGGGNRDGGFFLTRFGDGVGVRSEILKPMMNMNRRLANENLIAIILSLSIELYRIMMI